MPAAFATRCVRPPRRLITKVYLDGSPSKLWLALPHVHTVGPGAEMEAKRGLRARVGGAQRQGAQTVFLLPTPGVCEAEVHEQDFVSLHVPVSVPLLKGHLGGFTVPRGSLSESSESLCRFFCCRMRAVSRFSGLAKGINQCLE